MNDVQLYLSIGIPSLLVVLSWLSNNSRHDRTDARVDAISRRFDDVITAIHSDSLEIMRSMTALHERVAVIQTKQSQQA